VFDGQELASRSVDKDAGANPVDLTRDGEGPVQGPPQTLQGEQVKCNRCTREVPRLAENPAFADGGVCGICDITLAKQFPGVSGFDYAHQVHPEIPDEVKGIDSIIKALSSHRDPRQRFNDSEAALVHRVAESDKNERLAYETATPKKEVERKKEEAKAYEQQVESNIAQAQKDARATLREANPLFHQWKRDVGIEA